MAERNARENEPLVNSENLSASYVNVPVDVSEQFVEKPDPGKVPMFICIGPKLNLKRILKLYYFILIYLLFGVYYKNTGKVTVTILRLTFFPNRSNESSDSGDPFKYDHPYWNFGLQMFEFMIPGFLSLIFAFVSDYAKYQRAYLLNYSLGISTFAAFVITICGYILNVQQFIDTPLPQVLDTIGLPLHKILSILGLISFVIGLAMYLPISLAYGLDLLQGTKWKVAYFYFPLMYTVNSVSAAFSYLKYLEIPTIQIQYDSLICLVIVTIAWVLFIIGRGCRILPDYKLEYEGDFTIYEGIKIFCYALKKRIIKKYKSPRDHWFIQLASDEYRGKFNHGNVQKVSAFFRINFCLILLVLIFAAYQVVETVFPHQGYTLTMPSSVNLSDIFCKSQTEESYIDNLLFINYTTIILCIPLFELFFWYVSTNNKKIPKIFDQKGLQSIKSRYQNIQKAVHEYFHPFDPILKKIFWGLFFGLAGIACALIVEVIRIVTLPNYQTMMNCTHLGFHHTYIVSNISIFSQVPQYIIGSLLEVLSIIGIQQFLYFQCFTTFKDSYKGFFLGLYYFYLCIGLMIANITYSLLDALCRKSNDDCKYCFIYNDSCSDNDFKLTTVIWAALILIYLIIIVFFGIFSHYRHFQNKRMHLRGEKFHVKFAGRDQLEG